MASVFSSDFWIPQRIPVNTGSGQSMIVDPRAYMRPAPDMPMPVPVAVAPAPVARSSKAPRVGTNEGLTPYAKDAPSIEEIIRQNNVPESAPAQPVPQPVPGVQYALPNYTPVPQTTFNNNGPCPGGVCDYNAFNPQTGGSTAQSDAAARAFYGGGAMSPLLRAAFNRLSTENNAAQFNNNTSGAQLRQQQLGQDPEYWRRVSEYAAKGVSLPEASRIAALDTLPSQDVGVLGPQLYGAVDNAGRAAAGVSARTGVFPEFFSPAVPTTSRNGDQVQLNFGNREFNAGIPPGQTGQQAQQNFLGLNFDPKEQAKLNTAKSTLAIKQQYALDLQKAKTAADLQLITAKAEANPQLSFEEKQAIRLAAAQKLKASPAAPTGKAAEKATTQSAVDAAAR